MTCSACGSESPAGQRFCGQCGQPLEPSAAPSEERRLVTVLFADVTGSTALGETLDPEDLRGLLTRYYALARQAVAAHEGTLAKFIGDAVMAVFGLPRAHGDDAQRALSAALELRDRVRSDPKLGSRIPLRLGVNTGEVVATREASAGEFLIAGDAVNVAARLEQAAPPWGILCGERTARAAAGAFEFGPPIDVQARGKSSPVRALPVLARSRAGLGATRKVPLVGREDDLAQLELVARRAFSERRPYLVSLIAPAGTGKTRLLEEFLERLPGLSPGATVALAQCLPYGQRLTFDPLRSVLHRLAAIDEDARPELLRERLGVWAGERGLESPERIADLLAATVGAGEGEMADRAALFAAWRTAIEAAARQSPLLLVFEDLHWSSDTLLDLAEYVMQPRGDSPVLMLALARPELLDRRPAWGGGRRNYVSLALEPLAESAIAELVENLLARRSPEIVARVVTRSEGNPFYAGEIVRSLLDRLPSLEDEVAVESALATLPDTVQATVLARLDLLGNGERRVLQLGSVFGRAFRPEGLSALEPRLAPEAGRLLDALAERDLVRAADGDGYAFRHILIREVAYQTLPRAERWRLHAAAGRWLERWAAGNEEPLAELIAYHLHEAAVLARTLDVEAGELAPIQEAAVHWLTRSAEVAAAAAAHEEAARHLRNAIELAEPAGLADLHERLARVTGGDASAAAYRTAIELCRGRAAPADQELRLLAGLLTLLTRFQGSVAARPSAEEMRRLFAQGRALAERVSDPRSLATFRVAEGFLPFWYTGGGLPSSEPDLVQAEASARFALDVAERLDDARLQSVALDALGGLPQTRGDWAATRDIARRRLGLGPRLDVQERVDATCMIVWASALLGDLAEADRVSREGLASLQPGQATAWTLHLVCWRTYTQALLGRWDEVPASAERARRLWTESGVTASYALRGFVAALDVARARGDRREMDENRRVIGEIALRVSPDNPARDLRYYAEGDLASLEERLLRSFRSHNPDYPERVLALCADLGKPPAPESVRPALEFAAAHGLRILEAQARRALGLALGDVAELGRALELFEGVDAAPYVARSRCERALLTGSEQELAAGLAVLETLGDVQQLHRFGRTRAEEGSRG